MKPEHFYKFCEHCFCKTVYVKGIKHKKCCMCGIVKVDKPFITWRSK